MKTKIYVLTVSRYFPVTHPKKGYKTEFEWKIKNGLNLTCYQCREIERFDGDCCGFIPGTLGKKIHTIRSNYDLWKKRIDEVNEGKAVLSIRYWMGKPYNSPQCEFVVLDKDSGIGVQELSTISPLGKIVAWEDVLVYSDNNNYSEFPITTLAKNDGLSFEDFKNWFKGYDLSKPMAIIHFTPFRY